jgi:predicted phosphodiesterase
LKKEKNCYLANPGSLAGIFYKATFAILDTRSKKLELKILEKIK